MYTPNNSLKVSLLQNSDAVADDSVQLGIDVQDTDARYHGGEPE